MSTLPRIEDLGLGEDVLTGGRRRRSAPRKPGGEFFLKGPVPMSWLSSAGHLPGRALHVGVVLWMLAGMRRTGSVVLAPSRLREMGVSRHAAHRALRRLEAAVLVSIERVRGVA